MKLISTEMMRELDRRTISEFGVPGEVLMERAGLGTARVVRSVADLSRSNGRDVLLFAGRGNNGGDAFVVARLLKEWGFRPDVMLAGEVAEVKGDAKIHFEKMRSAGVGCIEVNTEEAWDGLDRCGRVQGLILVDGLLGTGTSGSARGAVAGAIRYINNLGECCPVVSVDVPSGLNADTGQAAGDVVIADVTVTMAFPKIGFLEPGAQSYIGSVEVVDIGIPAELNESVSSEKELITSLDVREMLPRRERSSHKGTFGHVLIIGGAPGYSGAVAMAAQGALRSGAGLVTAMVPRSIVSSIACVVPEAMIQGVEETETGSLSVDMLNSWKQRISDYECVLIGPGMTTHEDSRRIAKRIFSMRKKPVVVDADALNICAGTARGMIRNASCPIVTTPHPGEMGKLLGCSTAEVQADRFGSVDESLQKVGGVTVLKGAGTIVAGNDLSVSVNMTGNPGMASGGTGDVLGGVISALIAQGLDVYDAARAGVYIHGRAGDRAAWTGSQAGMIARDLLNELPEVFREITGR